RYPIYPLVVSAFRRNLAESRKPKAESRKPKAERRTPNAERRELRAESRELRAESCHRGSAYATIPPGEDVASRYCRPFSSYIDGDPLVAPPSGSAWIWRPVAAS